MSSTSPPRVQLVVSGRFLALFLVALSLLGGGYYWYSEQEQNQKRFQAPPYFVNRGTTIIRNCEQCLDIDRLKPQPDWKIGSVKEIPATEQRWFLAVEDPPMPVTVSGVLMLPVHPAFQGDPTFGFDQNRVVLVLYQNLQRKPWIEQTQPPAAAPQSQPPPSEPTATTESADPDPSPQATSATIPTRSPFVGEWKNIDSNTKTLTKLLITSDGDKLVVHTWAKCPPVECDWGVAPGVPLPPVDRGFLIIWDHKYALHRQEFSLEDDGRLKVFLQTHFTDKSGRRDKEFIVFFTKTTAAP